MTVPALPDLAALAAQINTAHEAVARAFISVIVPRAIEVGSLLMQAKDLVPHGQWLPWLRAHCPCISERTAQRYMNLAEHRLTLEAKAPSVADLTLAEAEKLITPPEPDHFPASEEMTARDGAPQIRAPRAKGRRAPKSLDKAWDRAKPRVRREFVKYHAEEITQILDDLHNQPMPDDPIEEALDGGKALAV